MLFPLGSDKTPKEGDLEEKTGQNGHRKCIVKKNGQDCNTLTFCFYINF